MNSIRDRYDPVVLALFSIREDPLHEALDRRYWTMCWFCAQDLPTAYPPSLESLCSYTHRLSECATASAMRAWAATQVVAATTDSQEG